MINTDFARRSFLKKAGLGIMLSPAISAMGGLNSGWRPYAGKQALKLNVRDFGALADGTTKDTTAIQRAIDRCGVLGGGTVIFPAGNYLTGAICLRSNVTLILEKEAAIVGSPDFADYPVTEVRWEGKWIPGHTGLIYAIGAENIGIIGEGKILGNHALGGRPRPQSPLRHPALIEPIGCKNIRLEGFSTDYRLMWSIHPTNCQDIFIKNLYIRSSGGNGDGLDIDSCQRVRIDGCDIATGDDCISLKSGRGMEAYSLLYTTEDVHITNCTFADSIFACIGIGSETSGGIRNVRVENCKFTAAKTFAVYIKSRPGRGAFIEDITMDNLEVSGTDGGFLRFNILASGIQDQVPVAGLEGIPTIRNFNFSNIHVTDVPVLVDGTGIHPDKPLEGFSLTNVSGTCSKGIFLANIKKANIKNIAVSGYEGALLNTYQVSGSGLKDAVALKDVPPAPAAIPPNTPVYELK